MMSDQGESRITKHPNATSSANPKSGKSYVMQPMPVPHSQHSARRSEHYHTKTIDASQVRPGPAKMTRTEHQLNNNEDTHSLGEYTKRKR